MLNENPGATGDRPSPPVPAPETAPTMDECPICLDPVCCDGIDGLALPGCGHRFHCACILTAVRRDMRCPVCRQVPAGVAPSDPPAPEEPDGTARAVRGLLRRRRDLRMRLHSLRRLGREMQRTANEARRIFAAKCRGVWRDDPVLQNARHRLRLLRRRERRRIQFLEAAINAEVPYP